MSKPPEKQRRPGEGAARQFLQSFEQLENSPLPPALQADLRATWWRLTRRHRVLLLAERGLILLDGGRP